VALQIVKGFGAGNDAQFIWALEYVVNIFTESAAGKAALVD